MKIAIVGAGISGLGAAWLLAPSHEVTVIEAAESLGEHSNTVDVDIDGHRVPVDTGFIVYNEHNYPNLTRLFAALDVETVASDMSFSVSLGDGAFEYLGSAPGLLAQPGNLVRPAFWRFLGELLRFYRSAPHFAERYDLGRMSLGELLAAGGYSDSFARQHLLPMAAAIWSSKLDGILDFPAQTFVQFFTNHGLFSLGERPLWRSVLGGSRQYVQALSAPFRDRVRLAAPVVGVRRTPPGVFLRYRDGREERFDQLVLATHADQALAILGPQASAAERDILGAFRYDENRAVLHRDASLMPRRRQAWAYWNAVGIEPIETTQHAAVSYWMNRLQKLDTDEDIFVTLNPQREPEVMLTEAEFVYHHPQFDAVTQAAQERLPTIQGCDRVWYCGSYCGYGFHEDGLQAGFAVTAALGQAAPWAGEIQPMSPAWRTADPEIPAIAAE